MMGVRATHFFAIFQLCLEAALVSATATSGSSFSGQTVHHFPPEDLRFSGGLPHPQPGLKLDDRLFSCTKWSVVTTIFNVSEAVIQVANLGPEWCLVVVGDKKTPPYELPDSTSEVVVLTADDQSKIAAKHPKVRLLRMLPWNHFGRKNFGYLYAIAHGAKVIWDFDDDNVIKSAELLHRLAREGHGVYAAPLPSGPSTLSHELQVYNPYVQLGASTSPVWPRGFPYPLLKHHSTWDAPLRYHTVDSSRVGVIQSAANHDPDMDAFYRLALPIPIYFKPADRTTTMLLPHKTFTPLNAQACLFRSSAFWMLFLPMSVHGRVCDIWRGYLGQRLLWETGQLVAYSPPIVTQFRNSHEYLEDLQAELPLYLQSTTLLHFLNRWKPTSATLPGQIEELFVQLYERQYLLIDDVYAVQEWLFALVQLGYSFPEVGVNPVVLSKPPIPCFDLNELELFLPVAPTKESFDELRDLFLRTLRWFFPGQSVNLAIILDDVPGIGAFQQQIQDLLGGLHAQTYIAPRHPLPMHGHDVQQWLMFIADNWVVSRYVGFVDTDTVFVSPMMVTDLFSGDKPRVIVTYGCAKNDWWKGVPSATEFALGLREPFRAMTAFPVVVAVKHLKEMREKICAHLKIASFDAAFHQIASRGAYSQFNIMVTYLWYYHQSEYDWDITECPLEADMPYPGQVLSKQDAGLTDAHFQNRRPRQTIHWSYEKPARFGGFEGVMTQSYCSARTPSAPASEKCQAFDFSTNVNVLEWIFEDSDFSSWPDNLSLHAARQSKLAECPAPDWSELLRFIDPSRPSK